MLFCPSSTDISNKRFKILFLAKLCKSYAVLVIVAKTYQKKYFSKAFASSWIGSFSSGFEFMNERSRSFWLVRQGDDVIPVRHQRILFAVSQYPRCCFQWWWRFDDVTRMCGGANLRWRFVAFDEVTKKLFLITCITTLNVNLFAWKSLPYRLHFTPQSSCQLPATRNPLLQLLRMFAEANWPPYNKRQFALRNSVACEEWSGLEVRQKQTKVF